MLQRTDLATVFPTKVVKGIPDETLDTWNQIIDDPDFGMNYRDNFMSYARVIEEGRFSIQEYMNAIVYCSHRHLGDNCAEAYKRTFPTKVASWDARGLPESTRSKYISAFNTSKLVKLIMEQSAVPFYLLNQDVAQQAINRLAYLVFNADSEKVQCDSANALLNHLKKPEAAAIDINIGIKKGSTMDDLFNTMAKLAQSQLETIQQKGMSAKDVAAMAIIEHSEHADE